MKLLTFAEAGELKMWENYADLKTITCVNHPTAYYLSKNPSTRSLHFIRWCDEAPFTTKSDPTVDERVAAHGLLASYECPCPYSDLRVVVFESADEEREFLDHHAPV